MLRPIWSPQDSVDTAEAFARELHNAERGHRHCARCDKSQLVVRIDTDGVCRRCKRHARIGRLLFSRSRFRRAARFDRVSVGLLLAIGVLLIMLAATPQAKAESGPAVIIAAAANAGGLDVTVFEFVNVPEREPGRGNTNPLYAEFAAALRDRPGEWGVWPVRSMRQAHVRSNVVQGRYSAMPRGQFEARVHDGRCLVRYIGSDVR